MFGEWGSGRQRQTSGHNFDVCYGAGLGRVREMKGAWEKSGSGLEELWSGWEAERTWLQLVHCALVHTVSYFGKLIRQKRKQGEPKSIFRLEIQEETSEYIY